MRVGDVVRGVRVVVDAGDSLASVRVGLRRFDEVVAVVLDGGRFRGFLTHREAVMVTSQKSRARAVDVALSGPTVSVGDGVDAVLRLLAGERLLGVPVVGAGGGLAGVVTVFELLGHAVEAGLIPEVRVSSLLGERGRGLGEVVGMDEQVSRVWSGIVYRGVPGWVVVRSLEEPAPVGVVSTWNFIYSSRWLFHLESSGGPGRVGVSAVMTRGVLVANPDTPLSYVALAMAKSEIPVVAVLDETGLVAGVVTVYDIARLAGVGAPRPRLPAARPVVAAPRLPVAAGESVVVVAGAVGPSGLTALDVSRAELPAVRLDDTVSHARRVMLRSRSNYLLVLDDVGRPVGVITKWSMLRAIALRGPVWRRRYNEHYFISYILDERLPRVRRDEPLENVARVMVEEGAEVVVVVDPDGEPVGFITRDDVVETFREYYTGASTVERITVPRELATVHPHHTLAQAVEHMKRMGLDALLVMDSDRLMGVLCASRLPFVAYEDPVEGTRSRRLVWVRRAGRAREKIALYVKVTPLLAEDATTPVKVLLRPSQDATAAAEYMLKLNLDGLPVARGDTILGIATKNMILRLLARAAKPPKPEKKPLPLPRREERK